MEALEEMKTLLQDDQTRYGNVNELRLVLDEHAQSLTDLEEGLMSEDDFVLEKKSRENRAKDYLARQGVRGLSSVQILSDRDDGYFLILRGTHNGEDYDHHAVLRDDYLVTVD